MTNATRISTNRGREIELFFNGERITSYEGETVATALLAANVAAFCSTASGDLRLPFCNMGTCLDCVVIVDGQPFTRACMTDVKDGMSVVMQEYK